MPSLNDAFEFLASQEGFIPTFVDAATPVYYGFERKDGTWYILKQVINSGASTWSYAKGDDGHETAWTNRLILDYQIVSLARPTIVTVPETTEITISGSPVSQLVVLPNSAVFSVSASSLLPLVYQWYKNNVEISGATRNIYTTDATSASDNGAIYYCVVSNPYGSKASAPATLTVEYPPDTTAPTISSISTIVVSDTSQTITWVTDEVATSQVEYGTTTAYGTTTTIDTTQALTHSVTLTGLSASTEYHFRVISIDPPGNSSTSTDQTFTTIAAPDVTAPTFSSIVASSLSSTSQRITWTTNEPSSTRVEYGTTVGYGSFTTLDATLVTSHSADITGLTASTLYHYRVLSTDAATNAGTSSDGTFTTAAAADTTPPTVSSVSASQLSPTSERIQWTTNELATSVVQYGLTTSYGSTSSNSTPKLTHSQDLTGLSPNTLYHYKIVSVDASANSTSEADRTFTTAAAPDTTAPTVSVTHSPANPTTTDLVTFTATASDTSGIASLQITVDGVVVASSSSSPLSTTPALYSAATHTYSARAVDASPQANVGLNPSSGTKAVVVTAAPIPATGDTLDLTVSDSPTATYPIESGVLFPKAAVPSISNLRLEDSSNVEQEAQFKALATWSDGSIKSALITSVQAAGVTAFKLRYGPNATRSTYSTPLTLSQDTDNIYVVTGPAKYQLSKVSGAIFSQVWNDLDGNSVFADSERMLSAPADLLVRNEKDSTVYSSLSWETPTWFLEEPTSTFPPSTSPIGSSDSVSNAVKIVLKQTGKLKASGTVAPPETPPAAGPVMILGASHTYGANGNNQDGVNGYWAGRLPAGSIIHAVSGYGMEDMMDDYLVGLSSVPATVVCLLGTNNNNNQSSVPATPGGVSEVNYLVDLLRSKGATRILSITCTATTTANSVPYDYFDDNFVTWNARQIANAAVKGYEIIDFKAAFFGAGATVAHPEYYISDGIHHTPEGMQAFVNLVVAAIETGQPTTPPPSGGTSVVTKLANAYSNRGTNLTYGFVPLSGSSDMKAERGDNWLEYSVDFGTGGSTTLEIAAKNWTNTAAPGLPAGFNYTFQMSVAGSSIGTCTVPGSTTTYQTGSISFVAPTGVNTVRLTWPSTNDAWLSGVYDANPQIRDLKFTIGAAVVSSATYLDYVIRYYFYADLPNVQLDIRLIDRTPEPDRNEAVYNAQGTATGMAVSATAAYLSIPYSMGTQTYTFGTTGTSSATGTVSSEHYILQTGNDNVILGNANAQNLLLERETGTVGTDANAKWVGWADVKDSSWGITGCVFDAWQRYPKGSRVQSGTLYLDLHPQRASDKPAISDSLGERFQRPRTLYFPKQGGAVTNRLLLAFHSGNHNGVNLNTTFQNQPRFLASAAWDCATDAIEETIPGGDGTISQGYDDYMAKCQASVYTARLNLGGEVPGYGGLQVQYGWRDWGTSRFQENENPKGGTAATYNRRWKHCSNDTHVGQGSQGLIQYMRTRESVWWTFGSRRARHYMDFGVSHCVRQSSRNLVDANLGPGEPHNLFHHGSCVDYWELQYTDNHAVTGGLPEYYLYTGDPFAYDTLTEVGDFLVSYAPKRYPRPFSSLINGNGQYMGFAPNYWTCEHRDWNGTFYLLLKIFEATSQTKYLNEAARCGEFLQQWYRQTIYPHYQNSVAVNSNTPSTGRGAWLLPSQSANTHTSFANSGIQWNGGGCWMHGHLLATACKYFEIDKDYGTIASIGGYTRYQWMDMLLQNAEHIVRWSYKPTIGVAGAGFSSGNYWTYDESGNVAANDASQTGADPGNGAPTTFTSGQVVGVGLTYAIAYCYQLLLNGDSIASTHSNPSWFTTQYGATTIWNDVTSRAYEELQEITALGAGGRQIDPAKYGWYGYEFMYSSHFFKVCQELVAAGQLTAYTPPAAAPSITFNASQTNITSGQSVTLTWNVANATTLTASGTGWSGSKALPSGSQVVSPTSTSTYILTAVGPGGTTVSPTVTVTVSTTGWTQIWGDEFNGPAGSAPSSANWRVYSQTDFTGGSIAYHRPENCYLDGNGSLVIRSVRETFTTGGTTYQYTSGRMDSYGKFTYKYNQYSIGQSVTNTSTTACAIEFRIKMPVAQGCWPGSVWKEGCATFADPVAPGRSNNWPSTGETDPGEWLWNTLSGNTTKCLQNVFIPSAPGSSGSVYGADAGSNVNTLPSGTVDQFHVYREEWSATEFKYYIDGILMDTIPLGDWSHYTLNYGTGACAQHSSHSGYTYNNPFFIHIVTQIGNQGGTPTTSFGTQYMYIDYIRVYQKA